MVRLQGIGGKVHSRDRTCLKCGVPYKETVTVFPSPQNRKMKPQKGAWCDPHLDGLCANCSAPLRAVGPQDEFTVDDDLMQQLLSKSRKDLH